MYEPEAEENEAESITGRLIVIKFHRDGFLIGLFTKSDGKRTSICGNMAAPQIGNTYSLTGKYETHQKYGLQFRFDAYSSQLPKDPEAIREYLDVRAKWVGPAVARALVDAYGEKTLDTLKDEPERVANEISGITLARAQEISENLLANEVGEREEINLRDALRGIQMPKRAFPAIVKKYGSDALAIVTSQPYRLAREIDGVSFFLADRIALKNGLMRDSNERILAGVRHVLTEATVEGHTFLPKMECVQEAREILALDRAQIEKVLDGRTLDSRTLDEEYSDVFVSDDGSEVFLLAYRRAEEYIAKRLVVMNAAVESKAPSDLSGLADDQIEAVQLAMKSGVFILTGPPGTGKSTTINKLIENFDPTRTVLCAPSGKAARRMSEITKRHASTIHSLLGAKPTKDGGFVFEHNEELPLDVDLVVVDETSMCDVTIVEALLRAIKDGTRLILIGDPYQLPSVGPGNVLKDLLAAAIIPQKELTLIKRQNPGLIVNVCSMVKEGIDKFDILFDTALAFERDLQLIRADTPYEVQAEILEAFEAYSQTVKDPLRSIQVLTALREKTELSVKALNEMLRNKLNAQNRPAGGGKPEDFWLGDKVIQTKNDYTFNIMNGDIGFIEDIDRDGLHVVFDDPVRRVVLPRFDNRLELAYAITTHKFQGSEVPIVFVVVHSALGALVPNRPWLYTSISRAKKLCLMIGERESITRMIARNNPAKRWTKLRKCVADAQQTVDNLPLPDDELIDALENDFGGVFAEANDEGEGSDE